MKINISKLQDGLNEWTEQHDPLDLALTPDVFSQPLEIDFIVEKGTGKHNISVTVKTTGQFFCSSCGEDVVKSVNGSCSVRFIQRDRSLPDEMPGDELRSFMQGEDELDITTELRDAAMISIPMRILCRDDCLGLCPVCNGNLNEVVCDCKIKRRTLFDLQET